MPRKPTTKPSLAREVIPTPSPSPCQCGNIIGCDDCWAEMCRTQGYSSPADGISVMVPWQIHVNLADPVHDELTAVAAANGMSIEALAHDILLEWAGRRIVDREPQ